MEGDSGEIRVGLIGCGRWGRNLARVLHQERALAAMAVRRPEAVVSFAQELGVQVDTVGGILRRSDIQAVVIATPTPTHSTLIRLALANGKHVLVEKPMAIATRDAETCSSMAKDFSRILMPGHTMRHHPAFKKVKDLVNAGAVGRINSIVSERFSSLPPSAGDAPLWELSPHDVSMVLELCGPPCDVTLDDGDSGHSPPHRFSFALLFRGGVTAQIRVGRGYEKKLSRLSVSGDLGEIVFESTADDPRRCLRIRRVNPSGPCESLRGQDKTSWVRYPHVEPLAEEVRFFISAILEGNLLRREAEQGTEVTRIIECVEQKAISQHG